LGASWWSESVSPEPSAKKKETLGIKECHTDTSVHFVITMTKEQMAQRKKEGTEKRFTLLRAINMAGIALFDREGRTKKWRTCCASSTR